MITDKLTISPSANEIIQEVTRPYLGCNFNFPNLYEQILHTHVANILVIVTYSRASRGVNKI